MDITINLNFNNNFKKIKLNFILITILFLAAFLRFYHLGFQSIWADEISTMINTHPSLTNSQLIENINNKEGFPYFYFMLMKILHTIFGYNLIVPRFFSAIMGVMSVFMIYKLGKVLGDKQIGYIAAVLLSINEFAIYTSQDARPYSIILLAIIVSLHSLALYIKNQNIKTTIYYGLSVGFLLNCSFFGILNVFTQGIILLIILISNKNKINFIKHAFFTFIIGGLLFLPNLTKLFTLFGIKSFWIPTPTLDIVINVFKEFVSYNMYAIYILVALLFYYVVFLLIKNKKQDINSVNRIYFVSFFLLTWIIVFGGIMYVKSIFGSSVFLHRYLIGLLPALILFFAFILTLISNKFIRIGTTVVLISILFIQTFYIKNYYFTKTKTQYTDLTDVVKLKHTKEEKVYTNLSIWLNHLFLESPHTIELTQKQSFDLLIDEMKIDSTLIKPFWFINADVGPYAVSSETQDFLDKNFYEDYNYSGVNSWGKHFVLIKDKTNNIGNVDVFQGSEAKYNGNEFPFSLENFNDAIDTKTSLKGWAYFPNIEASNTIIEVVLLNENGMIRKVPTKQVLRKDVTDYFKSKINIDNSGFEAEINKNELPNGNYRVAIFVYNKKENKQGLNFTDFTFKK
jgi:uncharacterized membrane protein